MHIERVEEPLDVDRNEDREPCPDDLCTGIIGDDGRCGVCGRLREGRPPREASRRAPEEAEAGDAGRAEGQEDAEVEIVAGESGDEEDRVPCPDDLCTGIIGEDGRCGICGRAKS